MSLSLCEEEDRVSCPVCFEPFRRPQSLKCGHVLCTPCIENMLEKNQDEALQCVICRAVCEKRDLRRDYTMVELVEKFERRASKEKDKKSEKLNLTMERESEIAAASASQFPCEICGAKPFFKKCVDAQCMQLFCDDCARKHTKQNVTKHHKFATLNELTTPVRKEIESIIAGLNADIFHLQNRKSACAVSIDVIEKEATHAKKQIEKFLTRVQEKCSTLSLEVESTKEKDIAKVRSSEQKIAERSDLLENTVSSLSDTLSKEDQRRFCYPTFLEKIKTDASKLSTTFQPELEDSVETSEDYSINIEIPRGADELVAGMSISVQRSVKARVVSGKPSGQAAGRNGAGRGAVSRDVSGEVAGAWSSAVKTPNMKLNEIHSQEWEELSRTDIPPRTKSLRIIKGQLCYCHVQGVVVFDKKLQIQKSISSTGVGEVNDVAGLAADEYVIASVKGLFACDSNGAPRQRIWEGPFINVQTQNPYIYATAYRSNALHIYKQCGERFDDVGTLDLGCQSSRHYLTLYAQDGVLTACCRECATVQTFSSDGDELFPDLYEVFKPLVEKEPYLCARDETATLIIDQSSNRIKMLDGNNVLYSVSLPGLDGHLSAVVLWENQIYAVSSNQHLLRRTKAKEKANLSVFGKK